MAIMVYDEDPKKDGKTLSAKQEAEVSMALTGRKEELERMLRGDDEAAPADKLPARIRASFGRVAQVHARAGRAAYLTGGMYEPEETDGE
jgi:hypothetical protein